MSGNLGFIFYRSLYNVTTNKLSINTEEKEKLKDRKLTKSDTELFISNDQRISHTLYTTYPGFITGTGMAHGVNGENEDFKIGCYFDHTAGIPCLPGSSVKGILRSVFPKIKKTINEKTKEVKYELDNYDKDSYIQKQNKIINTTKALWINTLLNHLKDKLEDKTAVTTFLSTHINPEGEIEDVDLSKIYQIIQDIFEGKDETDNPKSIYKRDIFNDAFPIASFHTGNRFMDTDSITPHIKEGKSYEASMLLNPVPLLFLKVLPNVAFQFNFDLKDNNGTLTAKQKELLFKKILLTIGAGAKTNVGYGQFSLTKTGEQNNDTNNTDTATISSHQQTRTTEFKIKIFNNLSEIIRIKEFEAICTNEDEKYFLFEFKTSNNNINTVIKKKDKCGGVALNSNVKISFNVQNGNIDYTNPNFKIELLP
ncbi:MAG TPA: type III-B CRISPR module RAMP protein Cmr6 [Chitinophagales bacterium]|nr:type III-B CRISPR module RAMP protein Cmr6 [Chitinophagales bacterium]